MLQLLIDFETQLGEFFQHLYISMGCYSRWKRLASEESGQMIWCYDKREDKTKRRVSVAQTGVLNSASSE